MKGEANLIFCVGPPAPIGPYTGFRHQKQKCPLSRGSSGEVGSAPHRLREDSGAASSPWLRRISLQASDWAEKGGLGSPPAPFGDFCAYKSHPGSGGGAPVGKYPGSGRPRQKRTQPEGLIKGDSEDPSSDKIPSPPGSGSKSFPPEGKPLLPIAPLPGQIGPWMQKPPGFSVGICPLFFYRLLKCSRIVLY